MLTRLAAFRALLPVASSLVASISGLTFAHAQCDGRWDTAIGAPGVVGTVRAITVLPHDLGGDVIIGGRFATAGGMAAGNIARYSPSTNQWSTLGAGLSGGTNAEVRAMAMIRTAAGAALLVGGEFTSAGTAPASSLAMFDLQTGVWSAMSTVQASSVSSMAVMPDGDVVIGGMFLVAPSPLGRRIVRYRASADVWIAIPSQANRSVLAIAPLESGDIIVGGSFGSIGGAFGRAARLNASTETWSGFGTGPSNWVYAVAAPSATQFYVGGIFHAAGDITARGIARYDTTTGAWSALSQGIDGNVAAIQILNDGSVVAAGSFGYADGVAAGCIARYDPTRNRWSPLAGGVSSFASSPVIHSLALLPDGDLVLGGFFNTAGNQLAHSLARFDFGAAATLCPADFDCSGAVNISDILWFVSEFLNSSLRADINDSGDVSVQDLFDFLAAYFARCP